MKKDKKNRVIVTLCIVLISLLILLGLAYLILPKLSAKPDVKIPDVSTLTIVKAEEKLKELGFEVVVDTKKESSDTIEAGSVIGTSPEIGRTVKKGTSITIIESTGTKYYTVEDLKGKNYIETKALLETVQELYVLIERKNVENKDDYKDKTDIIIDQNPAVGTKLVKGDTITLYIPNITSEYPDMVGEGWNVDDARAFTDEYGINLTFDYKETTDAVEGLILSQSRAPKSTIIKGTTLKVVVATKPKTDNDILQDNMP